MIAQTKGFHMGQTVTQAVLTDQAAINEHQTPINLALFKADGSPLVPIEAPTVISVNNLIATVGKTTTSPAPAAGSIVPIKFNNGNSAAAPTVAFDGGSAKPILLGGATPAAGEITVAANGIALFFYDGTSLHQIGVYS